VKDIDSAERCIKGIAKKFQYRKYKEVYEMDIESLKELLETCAEVSNKFERIYERDKKNVSKKIKDLKGGKFNYFMFIDK
jgi:hypothetical protein